MTRVPLVTHDTNTGVFSVDLGSGQVARTAEFDDSHLVDLDAEGRVLSIEILTPDDPKIEEMAARFGFEDQVPEILAAVAETLAPQIRTATTASSDLILIRGTSRVTGNRIERGNSAGAIPPREVTLS